MESAQLYFQQKGPQEAPLELPGGVDRKHGVDSDSSFHNMLGNLSQNHENERMKMRRTRTMRRKRQRTWQLPQWWRRWLQRWLW